MSNSSKKDQTSEKEAPDTTTTKKPDGGDTQARAQERGFIGVRPEDREASDGK